MTAPEIEDWLSLLGRSDQQRLAILDELLDNALEDNMSPKDFLLTRKARAEVAARIGTPSEKFAPTYTTIAPEGSELEEEH